MKLSDFTEGKNNNFKLLRILAAFGVLVDHSFALALGSSSARPLMINARMDISLLALDVFFFTSGFLVTSSLMNRQHLIEYVFARVLRIYPALLVMQLLTVFGLGLFLTTLPWPSYLFSYHTMKFWIKDSILIDGLVQTLPGVFQTNPLNHNVNSPLWTLPYELGLYGILAAVWVVLARLAKSVHAFRMTMVGCALAVVPLLVLCHSCQTYGQIYGGSFLRLGGIFFIGAAAFVFKDRIVLSRRVFWSLLIVLPLLSMVHERVLFAAYIVALPYLLLYLAYVPAGFVRKYNQLGDYSYGVYIYGWPLQQTIVFLSPGISVPAMLLLSAAAALPLAVLSWHVIEQPALQLKNTLRQMFSAVGPRIAQYRRVPTLFRN